MAHGWILDVLSDLKTYAQRNGLAALAEQLDDTRLVAAAEIATMEVNAPVAAPVKSDASTTGDGHRTAGAGDGA